MTERMTVERLAEIKGNFLGAHPRVKEMIAEIETLTKERDEAVNANQSAAVCSSHADEFTQPGCLVCDAQRLTKENEELKQLRDEDTACLLHESYKTREGWLPLLDVAEKYAYLTQVLQAAGKKIDVCELQDAIAKAREVKG